MDIFDFLFGYGGAALKLIFQFGFIPKEEDFLELTDQQYLQYRLKVGECEERIFMLAPVDPQNTVEPDSTDLPVVTESQKKAFIESGKLLDIYCKEKESLSDEEKLRLAAAYLPDVFTKGTKYEKYTKFTVSKHNKDQ